MSGGGSILSGIMGANAANQAASTEANAYNQATALEQQIYGQTQQNLQPWISGGQNALAAYQKLLGIGPGGAGATNPMLAMLGMGPGGVGAGGINPAQFQGSPGYQFQLGQGLNAVTNSAAARGGLGGNALKALQGYGTGLANQDWSNYLAQLSNAYGSLTSNLSGLSSTGAQVGSNLGQTGMYTGGMMGGNMIGAGQATASGIMGSTNALAGGIQGAIPSFNNAMMTLPGMFGSGGGATFNYPGQAPILGQSTYS